MSTRTLRWGIIATGGISTKFAQVRLFPLQLHPTKLSFIQDLLVDPSTRDVSDVSHAITAVGSRSNESATKFVEALKAAQSDQSWSWGVKQGKVDHCKAYGTYAEVFADSVSSLPSHRIAYAEEEQNVDVVYIGTPHTSHHENTKDALNAGKHVLCEKPFTLDVTELDELIALAKEKNLFLME